MSAFSLVQTVSTYVVCLKNVCVLEPHPRVGRMIYPVKTFLSPTSVKKNMVSAGQMILADVEEIPVKFGSVGSHLLGLRACLT